MAEEDFKFEDIPKCFYDLSLKPAEWENALVNELVKIGYYKKDKKGFEENMLKKSKDILPKAFDTETNDPLKYLRNNFVRLKEEYGQSLKEEKERRENPNRIYCDKDLRIFLYNKGIKIPNQEMDRGFYLRERLSSIERKNLLEIISGFDKHMISERRSVPFAVLGIGTSVFSERYFEHLQNGLLKEDFSLNSEVIEESHCIENQCYDNLKNWKEYVEVCFNSSPAIDEKIRPISEKDFNNYLSKKQERYVKKKTLGEILKNKGEDLDFAVCLEETTYGSSSGDRPSNDYSAYGWDGNYNGQNIENLRFNFVNFLKNEEYKFKEEIEMLNGADYDLGPNGELRRIKDIHDNDGGVRTYRVFPKEGREMHFYFYNHMADMKVKNEIILNLPFVQIERGISFGEEFGVGKDLEAAILNGEKTGIYENPEILRWSK